MKRTNKAIIALSIFIISFLFTLFMGLGSFKASAAISTTPTCTTYGNYTYNGTSYSGCPSSRFTVEMHGSNTSGIKTIYNDERLNWGYYKIKVIATNINQHVSFKIYRNNYLHTNNILSGSDDCLLYSGTLSDGEYRIEYTCNVKDGLLTKEYVYTYRFVVDTSSPTYTLQAGGKALSSGSYTNTQVVYTANDESNLRIRVKRPDDANFGTVYANNYTVAATAENNGLWQIYAMDSLDNASTVVSFYMDTIAPIGTITNSKGATEADDSFTNKSIKFSATDDGGISYLQVIYPGTSVWKSYTSGTLLSSSYGWYYFRAVDKAGNISNEYSIYYDASAPVGTLYGGTSVIKASGDTTNAAYIRYLASDSHSGVANCYVKMPNSTSYSLYASGTQLSAEGTYYFYSVDKSTNHSSTLSVTLDKSKPTGTLYAETSAIKTGQFTNARYIKFVPSDNIALSKTYVKKPGSSSYTEYASGTQLTAEGTYSFYSIDRGGNISDTYTITIDRRIPVGQLYTDGNPIANNSYTNGTHISFICDEKCYVKLPDSNSFVEYLSGAEYYKPGKYVFYGITEAGNSTGYHTLIIDRTTKTANISNLTDGKTNGDVQITWTDGDANLYAPIKSVTINGKAYTKGSTIYTIDTGVYKVLVTDSAGNTWTTEFTSTKKNVLTDTLQKEYFETFDFDNNIYAFSSYENAFEFATNRENHYVRKGEWKSEAWDAGIPMDALDAVNAVNGEYFIYKKSGNPDELVAYFTAERLNTVIAEYAEMTIETYYYWQKEPDTIADDENMFSFSDSKTILANAVTIGDNVSVTLNGEAVSDTLIEVEGKHTLKVFDTWGNICEYTLIIVRSTPDIHYAVGNGSQNTASFDRTYYFKDTVTISISDIYDEMAMFSAYDENYRLIGHFSIGEILSITESGTYSIVSVNHAGYSSQFKLCISLNAPKLEVVENTENKQLNIIISKSEDKESNIQTLEIYKSLDNGETWIKLDSDDYGTVISTKHLEYSFRTSGIYKIFVTDEFRTGIDTVKTKLNYVQAPPEVALIGVDNNGYTNTDVKFEWYDEATVTVTKNGTIIDYRSGKKFTDDGEYTITIENFDGYKAVYCFTIDTAAPELKIEGASNKEAVRTDVAVFFTEQNLITELFKNDESIGVYNSGDVLSSDGQYKLVVSDLAGNTSNVEFTIDKTVDFAINVNDNGLSNSVIANANENVTVKLTKNGEEIEYILVSAITEPADYVLEVIDKLGNYEKISFTIVEPTVKALIHNFDDVKDFVGVTVNGEDKRLNYGTLELTEDGTYEVGVIVKGNTYLFKITIDSTPPTLKLKGVHNKGECKNPVTIGEPDENATVTVFKEEKEISYTLGNQIIEPGKYTVMVVDEVGNVTEYSFTIRERFNGGIIALIVIAPIVVLGTVVAVIIIKKKDKI